MAGGTWDRLEQVFEDRVARALAKLGVYTQDDVARLAERVDRLSDAVNALIKARGGKPPAARTAVRTRATFSSSESVAASPREPAQTRPVQPASSIARQWRANAG